MKKTFIFAAAAALSIFASCQKEEIKAPSTDSNGDLVFTATIDVQDSKTTVNALSGKVAWVIGDEITISDCNSTSAKYTVTAIERDTLATFTKIKGEKDLGDGPYDAIYGTDPAAGQIYSATAPALPMSAHSETTRLKFTVTCGLLELGLKAGESVTSIEVTGTPTEGSETTYTLTCSTPVSIASGAKFFIALPAGSYTSFLINGQNGAICKKEKLGESVDIAANNITPISFKSLHFAVQLWKDGPYWATTNIGADTPEAYGQYFAWGYTEGCVRNSDNTGWVLASDGTTAKQFNTTDFPYRETAAYEDAATVNWGTGWSVPTAEQLDTLVNYDHSSGSKDYGKCSVSYVKTGVIGVRVTGTTSGYTSNSIFLPAAGCGRDSNPEEDGLKGFYWSTEQTMNNTSAYFLTLFKNGLEESATIAGHDKCYGSSVRPVYSVAIPMTGITISSQEETINVGSTVQLSYSFEPTGAKVESEHWTSSDSSVASVDQKGLVTGNSVGTAAIMLVVNGFNQMCTITVQNN